MKKFFALALTLVLILSLAACDNNDNTSSKNSSVSSSTSTSVSTNASSSTQDIQGTEMNLTQIHAGDYSSLLGTWTEVAYIDERTGETWHAGTSEPAPVTLSVSTDKIVYSNSAMVMQGNTITDKAGSHLLRFETSNHSLFATIDDSDTAIYWTVEFLQKSTENWFEPNNGVKIDNTKNLISISCSGMQREMVFAQTDANVNQATQTPSSSTVPSSTQDTQHTEMNFNQIQGGDYSSLLGTWTKVAYSYNSHDGTGQRWSAVTSDTVPDTLSVSTFKIDLNDPSMVMQGHTITDKAGSHLLSFSTYNDSLFAEIYDSNTAINWTVTFHPKGIAYDFQLNNGVKIDNTKNLIYIWFSGMQMEMVFAQTDANVNQATKTPSSSTVPSSTQGTQHTKMNFKQIQAGDYSSLLGTWTEVAYSYNPHDDTGLPRWVAVTSDTFPDTLSVSTDKIDLNDSSMVMQGNTITDMECSHLVEFFNSEGYLYADIGDTATIAWGVSFHPKGIAYDFELNNGVKIDNTKNLISIWYSGGQNEIVFAQN